MRLCICENGHVFDWENRATTWDPYVGEYDDCCPYCGMNYEQAAQCEGCGENYREDDLICGVCKKCIDEYRTNFELCYKASEGVVVEYEINAAVACLLDPSDVNQILLEYIKKRIESPNMSEFVDVWRDEVIDHIGKEGIKK